MFVVLPIPFRAYHHDLVPEKFAAVVVLFPVFWHEDFEDGMGTKTQPAAGR